MIGPLDRRPSRGAAPTDEIGSGVDHPAVAVDGRAEASPASRYLDAGGPLAGAPGDGLGDAVLRRADRFHPSGIDHDQLNTVHRVVDGRHHFFLKADDGFMRAQAAHELLASRLLRRVDHRLFVPTRAADGPAADRPRLLIMDAADRYPTSGGWTIHDHRDGAIALPTDRTEALRLQLFDYAAGSTDRHLGNYLEAHGEDGQVHLVAIDHGACFGVADRSLGLGPDSGYRSWVADVGPHHQIEALVGRAYADVPADRLRSDVHAAVDRLASVDVDAEVDRVVDGVLRGRGMAPTKAGLGAERGWLDEVPRAAAYWKRRVARLTADVDHVADALIAARSRS